MSTTSLSDTMSYRQICKLATEDEKYFANFKQNYVYNEILEHLSQRSGEQYLEIIKRQSPDLIASVDLFKKNDIYGNPRKFFYDEVGEISPTTLRYMKVLSDLKNRFGDLSGKKILEIGTGYGGQSVVINSIYQPSGYFHVDLNETLGLAKKYIQKFDLPNHHFVDVASINEISVYKFDLVISNYAYSEVAKDLQKKYYEKLISGAKNGYFTLNFIPSNVVTSLSLAELSDLFKEKNPKLESENPNTYPGNVVMTF